MKNNAKTILSYEEPRLLDISYVSESLLSASQDLQATEYQDGEWKW